jgi:hypothetical protein
MTSGFAPQSPTNSPALSYQTEQSLLKDTLFEYFAQLPDPRIDRTKNHLLLDIIAIAILAVIAGADGWEAIETFGKSKQAMLGQFLSLPNGIQAP